MSRLDAALEPEKSGTARAHISALPPAVAERLAARDVEGTMRLAFDEPPPSGAKMVARCHPLGDTRLTEELLAHRAAQAQELLKLGVRLSDDHFVCTQADGRMMQPTWITHEWVALISETGLPRIRFHDLRHAHATHMLAGGIHPKIASERLVIPRSASRWICTRT
jgi:hypothetical protein